MSPQKEEPLSRRTFSPWRALGLALVALACLLGWITILRALAALFESLTAACPGLG